MGGAVFEAEAVVSRLQDSRLRLVIGPVNSIYAQRNLNTGGDVSTEQMKDARVVTVTLVQSADYVNVLHVPIGQDPG